MRFAIFSLAFDTPVHFGEASQGGGLEQAGMGYPADTLFSALCTELSAEGALADLARLREGVTSGRLLLSDLLPWQVVGDEMAYYLPRPILQLARRAQQPLAYRETCAQATARKRAKKLKYLRASRLADFLQAMQADGRWEEETPEFGAQALTERVNCRGAASLPYFVGTFSFRADAGLYLLAGMEREEDQDWLEALLRWLGCLGIGGKRSSGCGKFHLAEDVLSLDELGLYADDAALYRMLEDAAAPWQMTLSPLLPTREEIPAVRQGSYALRHVGGFVTEAAHAEKKRGVYLVEAGSCFRARPAGQVAVLGTSGGHEVLRYGKGLYVGVTV